MLWYVPWVVTGFNGKNKNELLKAGALSRLVKYKDQMDG